MQSSPYSDVSYFIRICQLLSQQGIMHTVELACCMLQPIDTKSDHLRPRCLHDAQSVAHESWHGYSPCKNMAKESTDAIGTTHLLELLLRRHSLFAFLHRIRDPLHHVVSCFLAMRTGLSLALWCLPRILCSQFVLHPAYIR